MDTDEGENTAPLSLHKYIYCEAEPVNGFDPSGHDDFAIGLLLGGLNVGSSFAGYFGPIVNLIGQVAGSLQIDPTATSAFQKRWREAIIKLAEAPRGATLLSKASSWPQPITLRPKDGPSVGTDRSTGGIEISLDPTAQNGISPNHFDGGRPPAPEEYAKFPKDTKGAAIVLGHELGHAVFGASDPVDPDDGTVDPNGFNIRDNEDPLRRAFSVPIREHYHAWPIPENLQ